MLQALIQDFETLREKLRIEKWVLFGGSWGTALSLAYAQRHTNRCTEPVASPLDIASMC